MGVAAAEPPAADAASPSEAPPLIAMAPSHERMLVAALPEPPGWLSALPAPPGWLSALPPPPDKLVRETKTFGTVTIDHRAHLARRSPCGSCHEKGPVGKIVFTPRTAHQRCRGCHVELARGPTECRGCHVVAPKRDMAVAEAKGPQEGAPAAPGAGPAVQPGGAPAAAAQGGQAARGTEAARVAQAPAAAPGAGPGLPPPPPPPEIAGALPPQGEIEERVAFARVLDFGLSGISGQRQDLAMGPWFQLRARSGASVVTYSVAVSGGGSDGRSQFLVGGGRTFRLMPRLQGTAVALGGLDATHGPVSVMPAVGLRANVEMLTRSRWSVGFTVTALADLLRRDSAGERADGATVSFALTTGYRLAR